MVITNFYKLGAASSFESGPPTLLVAMNGSGYQAPQNRTVTALPSRRVLRASPRRRQRPSLCRVGLIPTRLTPIDSRHRSKRAWMIRLIKRRRGVAVEVLRVLVVRHHNAPCMPHLAWKCAGTWHVRDRALIFGLTGKSERSRIVVSSHYFCCP